MACKKCDCEMRLYIQNMQHRDEMDQLIDKFVRLRRDMAWFEYTITGEKKALDKLEFELKNGQF
jgi:hypothetical protein